MITFIPDYQKEHKRGPQPLWKRTPEAEGKCNAVYLHGKLEHRAGFDIVYLEPGAEPNIVVPESGHMIVNVRMDEGEQKAVMIFWWGKYGFKGLICDLTDLDAIRYARRRQWAKDWLL